MRNYSEIKDVHAKSEGYLIPTRLELEDVLYDTENYMHEVFNCIIHANGVVTAQSAGSANIEIVATGKTSLSAYAVVTVTA